MDQHSHIIPLFDRVCGHLAAGDPRTRRPMSGRRVGFCLSDKKRRRMNLDAFADFCASHGVEVVEIDLAQPLAPQGPFDAIVHKLSDVIVEAEHDSQSQQLLANFESYVSTHPSTVLLDPLPAMTRLLDRFASYRIMSKLHNSLRDWRICSPPYLEVHRASDLPSIQQAVMAQGLSFPLICKTRVAHGSLSHEMSLIFSAGSLADIHPPCVLQSFVNHGAVLHKVFVTGKPSSSTATRCPSQSRALISQLWTSRCRASLLPAPRPWTPWSGSSEFSWAWRCSAWTSSSTYTHTPSPSSTSTSFQDTRECPSFSLLCSITSSQCWTNRRQLPAL
ncbi:inositol-tetrakisphosphate 1-kinase isoform X2 [Lates calcarifer]|uniref:Inositol-tetrakisphosphate 1-kinase isoform X2 n=1 Tax=Lates calcarifer TaxID=8187 RepID=A0AAJ8DLT6_LATCA|nr:inositol-tetrakisphosphate 1-kinase isoform X2 [Lates calcarifer]